VSRRVSLRIRYDPRSGLVLVPALALLVVSLVAYPAWGDPRALVVPSTTMRPYYLTKNPVSNASQALTACAVGYHMASLWEILDPSQLKYNTALGAGRDDSGQGPPSFLGGLVRTGYGSDDGTTPGQANCNVWTSNNPSHYGTYVQLPRSWSAGSGDTHVWEAGITFCSAPTRVWCVADHVIYLPLILRDYGS
jgi:hypothetical protein